MAARTAVGMLGVIARVELQAIDIPWVQFSELNLDLAAFRTSAADLAKRYDHIWAHWTFGSDKVRIECLKAETERGPGFHRYGVIENLGWKPPSDIKAGPWQSLMVRGKDRVRRLRGQVWMSMQYAVPLGQIGDTIDMIRGSEFYRLNPGRVLEFKFLKGNRLSFLGAQHGRRCGTFKSLVACRLGQAGQDVCVLRTADEGSVRSAPLGKGSSTTRHGLPAASVSGLGEVRAYSTGLRSGRFVLHFRLIVRRQQRMDVCVMSNDSGCLMRRGRGSTTPQMRPAGCAGRWRSPHRG